MVKRFYFKVYPVSYGFSLLELLMSVLIMGLLFAFIVPKLIQLRVEAHHEIVRQSCTELTGLVEQWLQKMIQSQDDQQSSATMADYVSSLANREPIDDPFTQPPQFTGQWIATGERPNNWNNNHLDYDLDNQRVAISGRWIGKKRNAPPESVVEEAIPGDKLIKNPFTKESIFRSDNDPLILKQPIPGAIAFTSVLDQTGTVFYAFCFQGRDSTTIELGKDTTFHDHQNLLSTQGIEQCVPFSKYR